jgi:hypothetical protein
MVETTFSELNERPKYYKYGDYPRTGEVVKDTERTEEEWNDKRAPSN